MLMLLLWIDFMMQKFVLILNIHIFAFNSLTVLNFDITRLTLKIELPAIYRKVPIDFFRIGIVSEKNGKNGKQNF